MEIMPLKVLIVDDNRSAADALVRVLRKQGDDVEAVYGGGAAIDRIRSAPPDLVLTDLKMEPIDGLAVLKEARDQRPPVEVIVFTAYGAVDVAVKAMRLGARDFLTKPVTVDQVAQRLDQLRSERAPTTRPPDGAFVFVAESDSSRRMLAALQMAAGVPSPVWLEGEVGSGRGHAARAMHRHGPEPDAPFTIRDPSREDRWPERGTVLLQDVDALPDDLQRGLHRSLASVPDGVRLVSTASTDGRRLVAEGRLRPELYFALAVVVIAVPPLRSRPDDVPQLLEHALDSFAGRYGRVRPTLDAERGHQLAQHAWPGNVRELFNLAERAVVMGVDAFDLDIVEPTGDGLPKLEPGFDLAAHLEGVERRILIEALRRAGGDRNQAGRLLGVERNTLRYKLNKYGLLDR